MRCTSTIPIYIGAILLIVSTVACGTTIDIYGALFKEGHPVKDEAIETAVASEKEMDNLKTSVEILSRYPSIQFEVTGHTDQYECSAEDCHALALRRALIVYRFLLDAGIDPKRLTSLTEYTSTRPIAGKRDDYQRNQRAEINVTLEP